MEKKIILTELELRNLLTDTYVDAFNYGRKYDEHWKTHFTSKGKDAVTYVKKKLKEVLR